MHNNIKSHFYSSVWAKYMPIVRILLKKSSAQEQELKMNRIDFERAGGSRKSGYKFIVSFVNGRADIIFTANELAQTFIEALQADAVFREYKTKNDYTFTFTTKFQLLIKNNTTAATPAENITEEELVIN